MPRRLSAPSSAGSSWTPGPLPKALISGPRQSPGCLRRFTNSPGRSSRQCPPRPPEAQRRQRPRRRPLRTQRSSEQQRRWRPLSPATGRCLRIWPRSDRLQIPSLFFCLAVRGPRTTSGKWRAEEPPRHALLRELLRQLPAPLAGQQCDHQIGARYWGKRCSQPGRPHPHPARRLLRPPRGRRRCALALRRGTAPCCGRHWAASSRPPHRAPPRGLARGLDKLGCLPALLPHFPGDFRVAELSRKGPS
mmetsp:Transcript_9243/g.23621  ORF Transcript_9243/g.23621 Transcript_9243/m.23621 type:complete len:248 (-) Transcript_9243:309-1052(-)